MNLRTLAALVISGAVFLISPVALIPTFAVPSAYPTIQAALDAAKPVHSSGSAVLITIAPGLYRENVRWQSASNAVVTIEAMGATVTGSDAATYTGLGNGLYAVPWTFNWALSTVPNGWPTVPLELRHREMLWADSKPLLLSLSCDNLQLGRFCIDTLNKRLTFHLSAEPQSVEVAMRETCAILSGDNLTIRGLIIEHCASDLDKSGTVITGRNITLEGLTFRQNVSGGLNTSNTTGLTTRGNLFADNGVTGWGGSLNTGLRSTDDSALRDNWRGAAYGWTGWNAAAVKHLRGNNVIFTNLAVKDNQTHGFWGDFNWIDLTLTNIQSQGNFNAGVYIEASPGNVSIVGGRITGNALSNAYAGLYVANSTNVTLEGVYVENTGRPALFIGGEQCRPVGDTCLPVASNWHIHNSTFISTHSALQFAPGYGLDLWLKTLDADFNVYAGRAQPFLFPSPYNRKDLAGYQAMLVSAGNPQEQHSRNTVPVATATQIISPTDLPTITQTAMQTNSVTSTPAPIVPTYTPTVTPGATEKPKRYTLRFGGELWFEVIEGD